MGFYSCETYRKDMAEIAEHIVHVELLKDKRVLVTGANGLIASYLVDALLYLNEVRGYNIDVYVLARTRAKVEKRFAEHVGDEHFHVLLQDVTQPLEGVDCKFDYVVHAACSAHPLAYSQTPVEIIKSNLIGTENVLHYMKEHGGGKFLFVSSSEVYGENKDKEELHEDDYGYININNPRSCYVESKRASETLCVCYSHEYGIDTCSVRPGSIFGPSITEDNSRADAQFLRKALDHQNIIMKSAGAQLRSYEYVSDAVSGILTVLLNAETMNSYNISSPISSATIRQFAECIAATEGIQVVFENPDEVEKAGYSVVSKCVLSSDKLERLGWKPAVTLQEGVRRMLAISKEMLHQGSC